MYGLRVAGNLKNLEDGVKYELVPEGEHDKLKKQIAILEGTLKLQGEHAMRRHNVLCGVKEVIDEYFGE